MDMNLDIGTTIIVLTNMDPQVSERVLSRIRQWLPKGQSIVGSRWSIVQGRACST